MANQYTPVVAFEDRFIPEPNTGCWLWMWSRNVRSGYGQVMSKGVVKVAHRLAWELYRGPIPQDMCVLHHCDTRTCVNPDHLFLGTRADNNRDRHHKGRSRGGCLIGENNPRVKLTDAMVNDLRKKRLDGWRNKELGQYFGIHEDTVSAIASGRWRHRAGMQ